MARNVIMKKFGDISFDWLSLIRKAEEQYNFQSILTKKLDNQTDDFDETTILEIILWKTNRYPTIPDDLIEKINDLRVIYSEEKAIRLLRLLLQKQVKGFDLPMASTVLRFACPDHLQIIDQRVYRFIMPDSNRLKMPYNIEEKIELYFNYIKQLRKACLEYDIPFKKSDRIFYQLDKILNKEIPIKY